MRHVTLTFVVLLSCLWAVEAPAQVTLGLKGGLSLPTLNVTEPDGTTLDLQTRTTFGGGAYLQLGLGDVLTFQGEALYVLKGARSNSDRVTLALDYIDVPLLFMVRVPAGESAIWPILYAGPVFSFETGCAVKGENASVSCSAADDGLQTKNQDIGGALGGGLEVFMGRWTLQLDVRYTHGFRDVSEALDEAGGGVKNRVWSFYLGLGRVLVP
jgi:hypothetical protein